MTKTRSDIQGFSLWTRSRAWRIKYNELARGSRFRWPDAHRRFPDTTGRGPPGGSGPAWPGSRGTTGSRAMQDRDSVIVHLSLDYTSIHVVRSPQSWLRTQLPIPVLVALPLLHRHDRKHMESWICIWITNFALSFTPPVAASASAPASASAAVASATASAAAPTWWAGTRPFRHSDDHQ